MEFSNIIIPIFLIVSLSSSSFASESRSKGEAEDSRNYSSSDLFKTLMILHGGASDDSVAAEEPPVQDGDDDDDLHKVGPRFDRFYYCGPKNSSNSCKSLCYAMGYPTHICGRVSCYCTF